MEQENEHEELESLRDKIQRQVASGFASRDSIIDDANQWASGQWDVESARPHVEQLTDELIQAQRQAQESWPEVTDCDRLDRAFAELEEAGILARQNFSCCGMCGIGDAYREIEAAQASGRTIVGYTFYHEQDTESAVNGFDLCLNYGSVLQGESPALDIAQMIVKTLTRNGLKVDWNGTWQKRIAIKLDWKRRWFDSNRKP
jgi:hypothetical protein